MEIEEFFKSLFVNKSTASMLLKILLRIHSACYRWISRFAIVLNNGVHPKHSIINYAKWFRDHIQPGWAVLDLGCNTGLLTKAIAGKASFVYGIDINPDYLQKARKDNSADNIEYVCADANSFNYRTEKSVDCIVMSNLLEHIEDRVGLLKKLNQGVNWKNKNEKIFLIRVPTLQRDWLAVYKKNLGLEYRLDRTHCIEYTCDEFISELAQAQIRPVQTEVQYGEIYAVCQCL
jgi:2-polyprenyl-3-methyl-5-hydroxy-6-metoxy-1,4-benzoquinol methylase